MFIKKIMFLVFMAMAALILVLNCVSCKSLDFEQINESLQKDSVIKTTKGIREDIKDENDCTEKDNYMEPNSHKLFDADAKFICVLQNICFLKLEDEEFDIAIVDPDD